MEGQCDVAIVGSGAGGLLAAMRAADNGLSSVVIEKEPYYGGSTATSGGAIWVPCHGLDSHEDSLDEAWTYLRHTTKGAAHEDRLAAYLEKAPVMVAYLEACGIACEKLAGYPDYYTEAPGTVPGRALVPREIDGADLGDDFEKMRMPFGAFMLQGR